MLTVSTAPVDLLAYGAAACRSSSHDVSDIQQTVVSVKLNEDDLLMTIDNRAVMNSTVHPLSCCNKFEVNVRIVAAAGGAVAVAVAVVATSSGAAFAVVFAAVAAALEEVFEVVAADLRLFAAVVVIERHRCEIVTALDFVKAAH